MPPPRVSIVIPTFNSARTLPACLEAIRAQHYPRESVELIIADGGSTDDTLAIARRFGCDRIVPNELRTGEAGKSAGIRAATGDLIALVDSDNILDSPGWLSQMVAPFADPEIVASEPLWYTRRDTDPPLTRYFAMLGMNDPLCLFLGNYDRLSELTRRWTGFELDVEEQPGYLKVALRTDQLPTIGANGFVIRRCVLDAVRWEPYFFDIDVMQQAVAAGHRHVAKVRCGIVHLYCRTLRDFARKQDRRIRDFLFFSAERQRTYPWDRQKRAGIARFALSTALVVPVLVQTVRGWRRIHDAAWLYHVPVCAITLWTYGIATLRKAIGIKPAVKSRAQWRQC
jgi:glycosyltransferase involved in cell wall biosynthesis